MGKKKGGLILAQCRLVLFRAQGTGSVNGPEFKLLPTDA